MAADLAESLGVADVQARTSSLAARNYLQGLLDKNLPLPEAIILDLDLGYESGYDLLRFCHGHSQLNAIRFVVWTVMGEEQRDICNLFKVDAVVTKADGAPALKRALEHLTKAKPASA